MDQFNSKSTVYGVLALKALDDFSFEEQSGELKPIHYKLTRGEIDEGIKEMNAKIPEMSVSTKRRALEDLSYMGLVGTEGQKYYSKRKKKLFKEISKDIIKNSRGETENRVVEKTYRIIYEDPREAFRKEWKFIENEELVRKRIPRYIWRVLKTILKEIDSGPPQQSKDNIEDFIDKRSKSGRREIIEKIDEL